MVQIFPLFETDSKDLFFHLFPKVHIYKIVKKLHQMIFFIMQSIQVSFLCVFVSENILKMEVLTLACLDLLYLCRLAYWAIPWWNSSWFTMTDGNSQQSKRKSEAIEKWHKHHLNAVNITGKKWNFLIFFSTDVC